jgi:hypothetical protein
MLCLLSQADRAQASEPHSDPDDYRVVTGESINLFLRSVTNGDTAEQQEEMEMSNFLMQAIIGRIVLDMIDEGYRVQMSDQDGGGLFLYAMPDAEDFPAQQRAVNHWIRLQPENNGADIISDYSTNLESIIDPIAKWCEAIG